MAVVLHGDLDLLNIGLGIKVDQVVFLSDFEHEVSEDMQPTELSWMSIFTSVDMKFDEMENVSNLLAMESPSLISLPLLIENERSL